jgi:hypothetical protein
MITDTTQGEILTLEEGIQEIITRVGVIKERPVLVAIYGTPNSGKSHLINKLGGYFADNGQNVGRFHGAAPEETFARMNAPHLKDLIYLFHCAWEKYNHPQDLLLLDQDPTLLARGVGMKVHLNVGIYNPNICRFFKGDYDLVIANTESVKKSDLPKRLC